MRILRNLLQQVAHIGATFRAGDSWAECPILADGIETNRYLPPEEPTPPPSLRKDDKDEEYRLPQYDEIQLERYKSKMRKYDKDIAIYEQKSIQAAGIIFKTYCTESMREKLTGLPDYTIRVQKDPIEMLRRIKTFVMQGTTKEYEPLTKLRRLQQTFSPKQTDDESLVSFLKRIDGDIEQTATIIGWDLIDRDVESTPDYIALKTEGTTRSIEAAKALIRKAREQFKAIVAFDGLQEGRYGSFQSSVHRNYAMGTSQDYPADLASLKQTLTDSNMSFKPTEEYKKTKAERKKGGSNIPHHFLDLTKKVEGLPALVHAQQKHDPFCYACGSKDHKLNKCSKKHDIKRSEWAINKFNSMKPDFASQYVQFRQSPSSNTSQLSDPSQLFQATSSSSSVASAPTSGTPTPIQSPTQLVQQQQQQSSTNFLEYLQGTQGFQMCLSMQEPQHSHAIIHDGDIINLDSGSSINSVVDQRLAANPRPAKRPVHMGTNAGTTTLDTEVDTPIGVAYYNPNGIANINSLSILVQSCYDKKDGSFIYMDSRKDNAIIHHTPSGPTRYGIRPNGLYGAQVPDTILQRIKETKTTTEQQFTGVADEAISGAMHLMVSTITGNMEGFTKRQAMAAIKARESFTTPCTVHLCALLRTMIRNRSDP